MVLQAADIPADGKKNADKKTADLPTATSRGCCYKLLTKSCGKIRMLLQTSDTLAATRQEWHKLLIYQLLPLAAERTALLLLYAARCIG